MQKTIHFLIVALFILAAIGCNNSQNKQTSNQTDSTKTNANTSKAQIEVMYFHSTNRCATCNAVENNAKKLLDEKFKNELNNGTIKFSSFNIDEEANKKLAEKYLISFSTLLIINNKGKEEVKTDLTELAFLHAKNNPEKYAELLKAEIDKMIK